jgi:hypothetical protein
MAIRVTLKPEVEAELRRQAEARGESAEEFAAALVAQQVRTWLDPPRASLGEFEQALDSFSEGTERLPVLTDEDLSRESVLGERE